MARFSLLTGLCLVYTSSFAQVVDTTYLKEVRVYGIPFTSYATGSKTEQVKIGEEVQTLSDKLIDETSLYFKTYGNGQLSSITMRGTTASQTAVLWNGVNINSPTLGQTDFSLIPLFLFDEVSLRYGSASSLYGTDAIGGSIMLGQSTATFKMGAKVIVSQEIGSFGKVNTGAKMTYGNRRWEFRTKAYRAFIENDFPYTSKAVGYSKRQNHASVWNYGFSQQIHFKISETQQLSFDGMYTHNLREIQPAVTNDQGNETLHDDDTRLSLRYQNTSTLGVLSVTGAYTQSEQDYFNGSKISTTLSDQLTGMITMDVSIGSLFNLRYGGNFSHYTASSENFNDDVADDRGDLFISSRYMINSNWIASVNIRQSFYDGKYAPFAPTIGTEVYAVNKSHQKIMMRGQVARAFRVPTLNDRFYGNVGNPSLKPEDAYSIETGLNWLHKGNVWQYVFDGSVYVTRAREMIVWRQEGGGNDDWRPTNLQEVHIHGVELSAKSTVSIQKYQINGNALYSYTRSVNQNGVNEYDQSTVDKQLAYVPIHSGRLSVSVMRDQWRFDSRVNVTGLRYIQLDNEAHLDPYALFDVSLSKGIQGEESHLSIRAEVNNILNTYYENLKSRAMPGRNFLISLLIQFDNR